MKKTSGKVGGRGTLVFVLALISACSAPARDIEQLVLQDSTYFVEETMEPFSGRVFKSFAEDPGTVQLTGFLRDGLWNGELTVYFSSGRIRYQGELVDGERCGAWYEDRNEETPEDIYGQLLEEIESLAMFPPCPES